MLPPRIYYTEGYKYQLEQDHTHHTGLTLRAAGGNKFVHITQSGVLTISAGYASDGASGPMPDIPSVMRGAFVHDALYQLIRLGVIDMVERPAVDRILRDICLEAGMWPPIAALVHHSVESFGGAYMRNAHNTILSAP